MLLLKVVLFTALLASLGFLASSFLKFYPYILWQNDNKTIKTHYLRKRFVRSLRLRVFGTLKWPQSPRLLIHKTKVKSVLVTMMTTMMVPIMVMRIVVMMITMNGDELWQNGFYVDDYVGSTADYYNRGPYETCRDLKIRGRRRQRKRR